MKTIITRIDFKELDQINYMEACARIRGVSVQALMRSLMFIISRDHLVAGILDDEKMKRGEDGNFNTGHKPEDKLFDALKREAAPKTQPYEPKERSPRAPTRLNRSPTLKPNRETFSYGKPRAITKRELEEELAQAVRNTAALEVE